MRLNYEQMEELVDYLQGSCNSETVALYDLFEIDGNLTDLENWREVCGFLDDRIFLCSVCGWWCESGDYAEGEESVCSQCGDDCDE